MTTESARIVRYMPPESYKSVWFDPLVQRSVLEFGRAWFMERLTDNGVVHVPGKQLPFAVPAMPSDPVVAEACRHPDAWASRIMNVQAACYKQSKAVG